MVASRKLTEAARLPKMHHSVGSDHAGFALIKRMTGRVHGGLLGRGKFASSRLVSINSSSVRFGLCCLRLHQDRMRGGSALRRNLMEWHFLPDHFQPGGQG